MNILLIDVDAKHPVIPLMKLSTYYKAQGATVELRHLGYGGYPGKKKVTLVDTSPYDKVFASILFNYNKGVLEFTDPSNALIGGTGHDLSVTLSPEVESQEPDYSIYEGNKTTYAFLTRGCVRRCPFCVVPKKEGRIRLASGNEATDEEIDRVIDSALKPGFRRVVFMDNNILGHSAHEKILQGIIDRQWVGGKALFRVHFNSGLDIRLVNDKNLSLLSKLAYFDEYIFSFDNPKDKRVITEKVDLVLKYFPDPWKLKFCILVGYNTTLAEDVARILWCKKRNIFPYIMRYEECWNDEHRDFYIDMASWCNKSSLKKVPLEVFLDYRHKSKERISYTWNLFNTYAREPLFA